MKNWILTYKYPDRETADTAFDRVDAAIKELRTKRRYTGAISFNHTGFDEENDEIINKSHFLVLVGDGEVPLEIKRHFDQACSDGESKLVTGSDVLDQFVYEHNRRTGRIR